MRITGGEFGGRNLKVPKSDAIRPTQDRVRAALFNMIQFEVPGSDFLDLFAGSGAVGIEALSRGAKSATFVESNRRHLSVLGENVSQCSAKMSGWFPAPITDIRHQTSDIKLQTASVPTSIAGSRPIPDPVFRLRLPIRRMRSARRGAMRASSRRLPSAGWCVRADSSSRR